MIFGDRLLKYSTLLTSVILLAVFFGIIFSLIHSSLPTWHKFGAEFVYGTAWNPVTGVFSALSSIIGTVLASVIALVVALPLSFGIASLATSVLPKSLRSIIAFILQMMAGVPSIIYGMWALFVLVPFVADMQPWINTHLATIPYIGSWFYAPYSIGMNIFTAGIILAIMILPILATMMLDLLAKVPSELYEASYAAGATHWETVWQIKLPFVKRGIVGSTILGLGRALGETMAVTFVIGNSHAIPSSLFSAGNTIASTIANEFTEATTQIYSSSLLALALVLMVITFATIIIARIILQKSADPNAV